MSRLSMFCMDRRGITAGLATLSIVPLICAFLGKIMGDTYIQIGTINNNTQDNHREMTINVTKDTNVAELVRSFMGGDTTDISSETHSASKEFCPYICRDKLKEQGIYTLEEFEAMFARATKGNAPELAEFLKRYKEQGILDFMGHTKKQIYNTLRKHFHEMRDYTYTNFAAAF